MDEENQEIDFLNLPDDEFDKLGAYPPVSPVSGEQESEEEEEQETPDFSTDANEEEATEEDNSEEESETDENDDAAESQDAPEGGSEEDGGEEESEEDEESDEEEEKPEGLTQEALFEALSKPIKANGRDITINTPEEAVKLIQMGAGYTKRLAELKPARQLFKTLEQHNMLDEASLGFAVDLVNGNKDAILKLMRDKGINPLELDTNEEVEYKSKLKMAPEQSIEFDDIMEAIKDSKHYDATVETVRNWDDASQSEVAKDPRLIQSLNHQMEIGVYDKVSNEVARLKALGEPQLNGLSDLQAYVAVGNYLAQQGALPIPSAGSGSNTNTERKVIPKAGKKPNPKTQSKKKAAGVPRAKPVNKSSSVDMNPLSMSDEEFDKMMAKFT